MCSGAKTRIYQHDSMAQFFKLVALCTMVSILPFFFFFDSV